MVTEACLLRREEVEDPTYPLLLAGDWRRRRLGRNGVTHCLTEVGTEDDSVQVGVERKALPREGGGEELIHIN